MLNLSDKELDRLSREAAEKYEVGHDPDEWPKLEQRLDNELGRSSPIPKLPGPRIRFLYAPAIILLIGTVYFILKTQKNTSTSTQKNQTQINPAAKETVSAPVATPSSQPSQKVAAGSGDADAKISTAIPPVRSISTSNKAEASSSQNSAKKDFDKAPVAIPPNDHSIAAANVIAKDDRKEDKRLNSTASISQNLNAHVKNGPENKANVATGQKIRNHHGPLTKETATQKEKNVDGLNDKIGSSKSNVSKYAGPLTTADPKRAVTAGLQPITFYDPFVIHDAYLPGLHSNSGAFVNSPVSPVHQQKNRMLHTNRSLQFGLLYAPDFSEVRYDYNNKIGRNIGITVSYELPGRLSITSGFIISKKNYDASSYDFHLPANCGISQNNLDFAVCTSNIYEIPLNLRYDIDRSGNDAFFVSGGFSSYIMGEENFKFYLHDNNIGYRRWQEATYQTGQIFWFSVLDISAGFERKISNSFSFQAEPFIKLPLTGVGFGSVNLSSYGINVSVKYAPLLKRSRH